MCRESKPIHWHFMPFIIYDISAIDILSYQETKIYQFKVKMKNPKRPKDTMNPLDLICRIQLTYAPRMWNIETVKLMYQMNFEKPKYHCDFILKGYTNI